jgi:hypothetical protein
MRVLSLVFSFLVMASLAAAALTYLERRVGQQKIQVQDEWLSSSEEPADQAAAYHSYGEVGAPVEK